MTRFCYGCAQCWVSPHALQPSIFPDKSSLHYRWLRLRLPVVQNHFHRVAIGAMVAVSLPAWVFEGERDNVLTSGSFFDKGQLGNVISGHDALSLHLNSFWNWILKALSSVTHVKYANVMTKSLGQSLL